MNKIMKKILIAAPLLLVLAAAAWAASPAERGRATYMKVGCHQCHGTVGQGGGAGPRVSSPKPWDAFAQFVRHSPDAMPPYREAVLSDADLRDIHAYLQSIPAPPPVADIPLLRTQR